MARVANERLKLLLPLREAANTTANKGGARHRRIPAVAQLSPKINQTWGALLLPLQAAAFVVILQEEALFSATFPEGYFTIKEPLVRRLIEFVPSYNAESAHSMKYEVVSFFCDLKLFSSLIATSEASTSH